MEIDDQLLAFARERCGAWFPELSAPVAVAFSARVERPGASIRMLTCTDSVGGSRDVVAKIPVERDGSGAERPRYFPVPPVRAKPAMEAHTLTALSQRLERVGDARLTTVRVLDYAPEIGALFTERVEAPTARQAFLRQSASHALGGAPLSGAVAAIGALLRVLHDLAPLPHSESRHTRTAQVLEGVSLLGEHLAPFGEGLLGPALEDARRSGARLGSDTTVGVLHGDPALRNFFLPGDGRVVALDVLGRWHGPVYEDLAYFLLDLRAGGLQALTMGMAVRARSFDVYRGVLLSAYFGHATIDMAQLRLFELLTLLDRWTSTRCRHRGARRSALVDRFYRRLLRGWLAA